MATMSELGFTWYGRENNGSWRFDVRLWDAGVQEAQQEAAERDRRRRCLDLATRQHCSAARRAKLLRRAAGGPQPRGGPNRHERRAQGAGTKATEQSWRWTKAAGVKL